jgi:hypothetical protein
MHLAESFCLGYLYDFATLKNAAYHIGVQFNPEIGMVCHSRRNSGHGKQTG